MDTLSYNSHNNNWLNRKDKYICNRMRSRTLPSYIQFPLTKKVII